MGFHSDVILPRLCDFAMRNKQFVPYRERVIRAAEGRVLEIGVGSGMNLPFYRPPVWRRISGDRHLNRPKCPHFEHFRLGPQHACPIDRCYLGARSAFRDGDW